VEDKRRSVKDRERQDTIMTNPCIISVAITGSVPRKSHNPAVPISVAEQIEQTQAAFEAGAALVHIHVRDEQENSSSDPARFAAVQTGVQKHCPGMIVQFSTGGRGRTFEARGASLHLRPDMASLTTGSCNFPTIVYENPPDFIRDIAIRMRDLGIKPELEIFDLAMLWNAADLVAEGILVAPVHAQFVMAVKHALPADRRTLEFELETLHRLLPGATWTAAGIGRHQLELNHWALELGGHIRTGLEDNIRWDQTRLATSNAELVARAADLVGRYNRTVATAAEARALLGLKQ